MITLLGSLLGFASSAFPEFLKIFQERRDRVHELAILDRQIDMMRQGHHHRVEEIQLQADSQVSQALYQHARPTGVSWVDALAGTVRPLITYAFFLLYALVKIAHFVFSLHSDHWAQAMVQIWHIEDQALFATVMSFWFGQRLLAKTRGNWSR